MFAESNTNTESNANSQFYSYSYTDSYAEIYSVAAPAPHAASAPVMGYTSRLS